MSLCMHIIRQNLWISFNPWKNKNTYIHFQMEKSSHIISGAMIHSISSLVGRQLVRREKSQCHVMLDISGTSETIHMGAHHLLPFHWNPTLLIENVYLTPMFGASSNNHRGILVSGYCVKEFGNLLDRAQINQHRIELRVILQVVEFLCSL